MELFRIGGKVVSRARLDDAIDSILADRSAGATQEEAARHAGVQRSFVSILETIGEVRRGPRIALVGFPIANCVEVRALATELAVDFTLVVSQAQRESIEAGSPTDVFNRLLETLAILRDYDTVVLIASGWRIKSIERILGTDVVGIQLGETPLREDKVVDLDGLRTVLNSVMTARNGKRVLPGRRGGALRDAAEELAGRWTQSRKS